MKNLQTRFLEFYLFLLFFLIANTANSQSSFIDRADSLFRTKKYTQSFEIYQALLQQGKYTPAMLLKMAYIQEGLGHIGQSLYCLRLYELETDDHQAVEKMQELATKYNLTGYEENDANLIFKWIDRNLILLELILIIFIVVAAIITFVQTRKKKSPYFSAAITTLLVAGALYLNNFLSVSSVITKEKVYLMEGPSAGASVEGIINDGNQLQVIGKEDVWLKVKWMDKSVFVKESSVLRVVL